MGRGGGGEGWGWGGEGEGCEMYIERPAAKIVLFHFRKWEYYFVGVVNTLLVSCVGIPPSLLLLHYMWQ